MANELCTPVQISVPHSTRDNTNATDYSSSVDRKPYPDRRNRRARRLTHQSHRITSTPAGISLMANTPTPSREEGASITYAEFKLDIASSLRLCFSSLSRDVDAVDPMSDMCVRIWAVLLYPSKAWQGGCLHSWQPLCVEAGGVAPAASCTFCCAGLSTFGVTAEHRTCAGERGRAREQERLGTRTSLAHACVINLTQSKLLFPRRFYSQQPEDTNPSW